MPLYVPVPGDPALGGAECAVGLTGHHIVIRDGKAVITDTAA